MNCRRIQDLIPLYVGGDLKDARALEVSSHLDRCDECRGVMDEFSESQQWARAAAEPDFDEAFFDELRESVFANIETVRARPSFFQLLKERISLKPALALTVALMVIAAGVAFYIYSGKTKNDSGNDPIAREKQTEEEEQTAAPVEKRKERPKKHRVHRPRQRQANTTIAEAPRSIPPLEQSISEDTDAAVTEWKIDERATLPEGMTRIEFHTADPNIRIIWFALKETDSKQSKPVNKESEVRSQKSEIGLTLMSAF